MGWAGLGWHSLENLENVGLMGQFCNCIWFCYEIILVIGAVVQFHMFLVEHIWIIGIVLQFGWTLKVLLRKIKHFGRWRYSTPASNAIPIFITDLALSIDTSSLIFLFVCLWLKENGISTAKLQCIMHTYLITLCDLWHGYNIINTLKDRSQEGRTPKYRSARTSRKASASPNFIITLAGRTDDCLGREIGAHREAWEGRGEPPERILGGAACAVYLFDARLFLLDFKSTPKLCMIQMWDFLFSLYLLNPHPPLVEQCLKIVFGSAWASVDFRPCGLVSDDFSIVFGKIPNAPGGCVFECGGRSKCVWADAGRCRSKRRGRRVCVGASGWPGRIG